MRFSIILLLVWAIPAVAYCILFAVALYLSLFGIEIMNRDTICDRISGWCLAWFIFTSPVALISPILYHTFGI